MKKKLSRFLLITIAVIAYPFVMTICPNAMVECYTEEMDFLQPSERPSFWKWYLDDWKSWRTKI